jgi:PAS domain S-box-containing protein
VRSSSKTKAQLVAELEELRARLERTDATPGPDRAPPESRASAAPPASAPGAPAAVQRLATVYEQCPAGIAMVDTRTGRLLSANQACRAFLGYSEAELRERTVAEITEPEDYARETALYPRVLSGELRVLQLEKRFRRRDGTLVWGQLTAAVPDATGPYPIAVGIIQDITDRKRIETTARDEHRRIEAVLESLPLIVYLLAPDHTLRFANRRFREIYGDPAARRCYELFHNRTAPCPDCKPLRILETGASLAWEEHTADGRTYQVHDLPFQDVDGTPLVLEAWVDITARRQAEDALRESERELAEAQRLARLGSWNLDVATGHVRWSHQTFLMLGFDPAQPEPSLEEYLQRVHPDDQPTVRACLQRVGEATGDVALDQRVRMPDGSLKWTHTIIHPLRDESGRVARLFGTVLDITDRKQAEEDRLRLAARAQQFQKLESLGVLAGGIAHDFNNLLTGVLGNASLALESLPATSPARGLIEQVVRAGERAAELTRQMLAYSGRGRFVLAPVDLSHTVDELADLLRASISHRAELRCELAPHLPPTEADVAQVRQVVLNLVTNASEALESNPGVITIRTGSLLASAADLADPFLHEELAPGPYVFLEVADTGSGMDEGTLARVFDPFFSTRFTGRGLGLPAVLGILRGHRGAVQIRSAPGQGTTIRALFPVGTARPPAPGVLLPQTSPAAATILVVDDEETVRSVAEAALRRAGFKVLLARDGREAVALFASQAACIALVVLDVTLPGLAGDAVFRELRQIRPDIRVVLSSGHDEVTATRGFGPRDLAGYVQKPYAPSALVRQVQAALPDAAPA